MPRNRTAHQAANPASALRHKPDSPFPRPARYPWTPRQPRTQGYSEPGIRNSYSGVSRSTLSRIERAVTSPTVTVLARVCWAYGHSVASLVAEAEGNYPSHPGDTDSAQL
ncbi:helix-turn-helix domain-containing protein [Streptomyces anthocyanicus]|uniref:helix-turn-helix domain-containing protein n=1 Tax=Streptomyces anthocyanicus TaxID=68174 RepID=UPI00224325CF|nr:helix-turn-helix transcriptional regulator [Streptomyces anthocyanicus]MCW8122484.1 helix-turn-helix domain-containing protein [Streptomyces anthocyanicus]